jgi:biotin carboxyl carrier protein
VTASRRERISVSSAELVIQPDPTDVTTFDRARFGELISALPPTTEDRAAGRRRFEVIVEGWRFEVTAESGDRAELLERARSSRPEHSAATESTLRAQIPGRIARIWVSEGETVAQGQRLLAIEAMKMENEIRAPHAGTVTGIRTEAGARVERGDELLTVGE